MKKMTKILCAVLALVLAVGAGIGGTLAWLTDKTETVTNTFTVGKLAITLDESDTDEYGVVKADAERVKANEYKLVPGHRYVKDPVVHVQPNSEASYVYVVVENGLQPVIDAKHIGAPEDFICNIEEQMRTGTPASHEWNMFPAVVNGKYATVHWKAVKATGEGETIDLPVFDYFQLRGNIDNATVEQAANEKITITAYAVQQDGFGSAQEAWNATFGK